MKSNGAAKERAYSLLKEYGLYEPTLDDLVFITGRLGYEVIDFTQNESSEPIRTLIRELGLTELIKTSRAFVYRKGDVRLLFVDDSMTSNEKCYAIAHELGHILSGHLSGNTSFSADMEQEFEANEFAHYLLHPGVFMKTSLQLHNLKGKDDTARIGRLRGMVLLLILIVIVLGALCLQLWKAGSRGGNLETYQMEMLDPFSYIDGKKLLGKDISEVISGMEKGTDYSVVDVYGDGKVHSYSLRPEFKYFGIHEGDTGIRLFTEKDEGITMVCYDFILTSADTDLITQKLQAMMACIRQVYGRGYDFGLYNDRQNNEKYINFDDFLNGIRQRNNGSYCVTWVLEKYGVSLTFNYDENQQISLGCIRFYTPSKNSTTDQSQGH